MIARLLINLYCSWRRHLLRGDQHRRVPSVGIHTLDGIWNARGTTSGRHDNFASRNPWREVVLPLRITWMIGNAVAGI